MLQIPARRNVVTLLLLMLAAASIWLFQDQPVKKHGVVSQRESAPDSFMENVTTLVLDKQGQPQYQLHASRLAHYAEDDRSELLRPQFTAFRPDGQRWTVVSESGRAEKGSEQIFLNGEVTIQRFADASATPDLRILSRDVHVIPAEDYAETEQAASIIRAEGTLNTLGMQVRFREGQVLLLSQVRGRYVP